MMRTDTAETCAPTSDRRAYRLASLDILRGVVIVVMALDHVRDFVMTAAVQDPTADPAASPLLFATRWITHFCAPGAASTTGSTAAVWAALHARQLYEVGPFSVFFSYPLLPWIGVMFVGYGAAGLFELPEKQRRKRLLQIGVSLVVSFVLVRAFNVYGDPHPWHGDPSNPAASVMSFLATTKYPPSLLFISDDAWPRRDRLCVCRPLPRPDQKCVGDIRTRAARLLHRASLSHSCRSCRAWHRARFCSTSSFSPTTATFQRALVSGRSREGTASRLVAQLRVTRPGDALSTPRSPAELKLIRRALNDVTSVFPGRPPGRCSGTSDASKSTSGRSSGARR